MNKGKEIFFLPLKWDHDGKILYCEGSAFHEQCQRQVWFVSAMAVWYLFWPIIVRDSLHRCTGKKQKGILNHWNVKVGVGPIYSQGLSYIKAWISNHYHSFLWDVITLPYWSVACLSLKSIVIIVLHKSYHREFTNYRSFNFQVVKGTYL